MGRSHPHSRLHTLQSQRSPRPGEAAHTLLPWQPISSPASAAGSSWSSRAAGGRADGNLCVFRFQRKIRASRERMRTWAPKTRPRRSGNGGSALTSPASSCRNWRPLSRGTATRTCPRARKSPCGPTSRKPEFG